MTFALPEGATIEAAMALYGMSRAHLVIDGAATRLTPVKGTAEHSRMVFASKHPGWSTTLSVLSFAVLAVALVLQVPQYLDWITHSGWWAQLSSWQFTSPISMPGWANGLWTAAGVLAGLERGLSMRHHSLLDE